jgi:hypothetical protein
LVRLQDTLTHALEQGVDRADPDLAAVVQLARQILATERQPGGLLDPTKPSTFKVSDLKRPMQLYLYARRHPAILYAVPIGLLALTFLLGRASANEKKERP